METCSHDLFLFKSLLNLKTERATHFSHSGIKKPLSEVAFQTRESLKRPCFPLPLSILAGSNLIMLFFYFLQPPFDSQENPSPSDFRENSSSFDFRENLCKTPKENQKHCYFFLLPVFSGSVLGVFLLLCHSI